MILSRPKYERQPMKKHKMHLNIKSNSDLFHKLFAYKLLNPVFQMLFIHVNWLRLQCHASFDKPTKPLSLLIKLNSGLKKVFFSEICFSRAVNVRYRPRKKLKIDFRTLKSQGIILILISFQMISKTLLTEVFKIKVDSLG